MSESKSSGKRLVVRVKLKKKKKNSNRDDKSIIFSTNGGRIPQHMITAKPNQIYKMQKGTQNLLKLVSSSTVTTFLTRTFQLSEIFDFPQFSAIFDEYRIDFIEYWLFPNITSSQGGNAQTGLLTTVIDHADATPLNGIPDALDFQDAATGSVTDGHYRCFKPSILVPDSAGANNVIKISPWLSSDTGNTLHLSIKGACSKTTSVVEFDELVVFHFSLRSVRS